jgi:phosphatidylserine/phosphatidylglycerophosphate/cardiolipin synthase-like enzyme
VGPGDIAGSETIQLFGPSGSLIMEASVFSAQPDTDLRLPVLEANAFKTGVAIVNLGSATSSVSLTLRAADGTVQQTVPVSLGSLQQTARFVSELFTGVSNFEGTMEITSTSPVASLALRQNVGGIFSTVPVSPQSAEADFSPGGGISARIVQEIQRARTSIDIEMYEFTRDEIADALIAAIANGVTIRVIADRSQSGGTGSDIARLAAAGISLKLTEGGGGGIMHNKVAIFDGRLLLTGSYNWSNAAETDNDENALFIRTPSVIAAYQSTFNFLWTTR